jgi:3-dehydroquinate synthase
MFYHIASTFDAVLNCEVLVVHSAFAKADSRTSLFYSTTSMKTIVNQETTIHFNEQGYLSLNQKISHLNPSSIFILVDENTMEHCYPRFMAHLETTSRIEVIEIDAGEEYKNIETCTGVWSALVDLGCDRKSLMINLGGGVITDLGGFVASTTKRGIDFIHVPTTVLAMVDAAIGGKNGVDLGPLKNQIGVIQPPLFTLIDTQFLESLPAQQLRNGSVEMFKHGLIKDRAYWLAMIAVGDNYISTAFNELIHQSAIIKSDVVASDPYEKGARKSLNYGHTIGHAIESYCLESEEHASLLHGEAVAMGIYLESFLSQKYAGLPETDFAAIKSWYHSLDLNVQLDREDIAQVLEYMTYDKKNVNGQIRFVLLNEIGSYVTDQKVDENDLISAFKLLEASTSAS